MTWNYFATDHGKGKVDGVGAILERKLKKEQIKPNGMKIQNAHEVVTSLREKANKYHASHPGTKKMVHKYTWEVEGDIDGARTFD
jgi:uncharacterized protein (DUF2236 family)